MIEEIKIDRLEELIHEMMIKIRNTSVTNSAEGNPIEIENAAAAPLLNCVSAITGSQELHGYDKPWAGGDGVNQCDMSNVTPASSGYIFGLTVTKDVSTGNIRIQGTPNYDSTGDKYPRLFFYTGIYASSMTCKIFLVSKSANVAFVRANSYKNTDDSIGIGFYVTDTNAIDITVKPLFYEGSTAPTEWTPYANICKIIAFSTGSVKVEGEDEQSTTYSATFSDPIYQGSIDYVDKKVTSTWGYIESYDGETLPGLWISDREEYAPGTTPTTGAEVAYELASAAVETVTVSNAPVSAVHGYNKMESSTGDMEVTYITEDFEPLVPTT